MGASTTSVAVTVTGTNMNGVLHNVVITQCTNVDSADDTAGERGCDSVCTGACSDTSLMYPMTSNMGAGVPLTYSGYIIDYECYDRVLAGGAAPDTSNIIMDPTDHKAVCLLLDGQDGTPPCEPNGYYLAEDCGGGNYHPKFSLSLDPVSHANAKTFLQGLEGTSNNIKVTVHGTNYNGVLRGATFQACSGMECDGVCTPDSASDSCEGLNDGVCNSNTVTYSGYIIDWYCYGQVQNGLATPDGSDVIASPADHSLGCLVGPQDCWESGYYLAERKADGTYHPKYDLRHASSRDTVLSFLQSLSTSMGASTTSVAVTVTGTNMNGVLHDVVINHCTNVNSADDTTGERGCDSVCTGACSQMSLMYPMPSMGDAVALTYSGYIIDYECYNRVLAGGAAPDASDIVVDPSAHKVGCMLLDGMGDTPPCEPNGYYLASDCGGSNYHPKFSLMDPVSHANAKAFLQGLPGTDTDIKVTAHGYAYNGVLMNATFQSCSGMMCDGVCTPDTMGDACEGLMDNTCTDNTVTYSGFIIDWYCYGQVQNGLETPDGSDVVASPGDHSLGCLVGPDDCWQSGYYLAERKADGTYHPKFDLRHVSSHDTVLAYLQSLSSSMGASTNNVAVTVTGINMNGMLHHASIAHCTNVDSTDDTAGERGCDSVCTGACDGMSLMYPTAEPPMADDGMAMDDEERVPPSFARIGAAPCLGALLSIIALRGS